MGFMVSLYAVPDRDPLQLYKQLGLVPDGQRTEFFDSPIAAAVTQDRVCIVVVDDRATWGETVIRPALAHNTVISCNINETCMYSAATCWRRGQEVWSVIHDSGEGLLHLETFGELPNTYAAIRDQQLALQESETDDVDHVFDIPVEMFVDHGGIRYSEFIESHDPHPWQPLSRVARSRSWWWPFGS